MDDLRRACKQLAKIAYNKNANTDVSMRERLFTELL
jgi:hypothetical protein